MNIIVLAGGLSPERHVSLVSGTSICRALRNLGHKAVLVDMFLGLEDYEGDLADLFDAPGGLCGEAVIHTEAPDLEQVRRSRRDQSSNLFGPGVLQACAMADIVFLGLHGTCGEDGRVQAAFDLLGIPYTGAGYLASGMAMNKAVTKQIMERCGILTPPWRELIYSREDIPRLARELPVPSAVKVIDGGSSLGVSLPETREELAAALEDDYGLSPRNACQHTSGQRRQCGGATGRCHRGSHKDLSLRRAVLDESRPPEHRPADAAGSGCDGRCAFLLYE